MKIKNIFYFILLFLLFLNGIFFDKLGILSVIFAYFIGSMVTLINPLPFKINEKINKFINTKIFFKIK